MIVVFHIYQVSVWDRSQYRYWYGIGIGIVSVLVCYWYWYGIGIGMVSLLVWYLYLYGFNYWYRYEYSSGIGMITIISMVPILILIPGILFEKIFGISIGAITISRPVSVAV